MADNTDCDDTDPATYPGALEYCNSIDDNCDGVIDEDSAVDAATWHSDDDDDSYGDAASPTSACTQPAGYVGDNTDCDDTRAETNPGASEYCNSIDDDCNGAFDDDYATDAAIWYSDADSDSFGDADSPTSACTQPAGHVADNTDCDDTDSTTFPGAEETCDGADDNCDDEVDEDSAVDAATFFADSDADTYGNPSVTWAACAAPAGYVTDSSDCDDSDSDSNPGADETCDGADNNCDGEVDEDTAVDATTWYSDNDSDSYGDLSITIVACNQPADYVADATDCDDGDAESYPGADEYCDGTDSDCDAVVDNDALDATTFFADSDSDSYGNASDTTAACSVPSGYVTDSSDCDDTDPALSPGNADTWYDGFDSDCAGNDDFDQDGDGQQSDDYGGDDCDDTNPLQYTIDGYCPTDWTQVYAIVDSGTSMSEASRMISDCEGRWSVRVGAYWSGITGFFSAAGIVPADLPALVYENISPYWLCEVVLIYEGVDSDGEVLWSYERYCSVANDVDYTWETNCDAP